MALVGPTAGYLWGFLLASLCLGYLCRRGWDRRVLWWLAAVLLGDICIFVLGVTVLAFKIESLKIAIQQGFLVFIPGELVKALVVAVLIPLMWFALAYVLNFCDLRCCFSVV